MKAMSRNSGPIPSDYRAGDFIMFRKEQGYDWFGPARVLGRENKVLWCLHQGVPVAAASNRARPANTSDILAHMRFGIQDGGRVSRARGEQQGFLDVTNRRRRRDTDRGNNEDDDDHVDVSSDEPRASRPRTEQIGQMIDSGQGTVGAQPEFEPESRLGRSIKDATGDQTPNPGQTLVETLARFSRSSASSSRTRSRSRDAQQPQSREGDEAHVSMKALLAMDYDHVKSNDYLKKDVSKYQDWQVWWFERVAEKSVDSSSYEQKCEADEKRQTITLRPMLGGNPTET